MRTWCRSCADTESPCRKKTLADGISQRVFPFGQEIRTGKTGRRTFIIMKADFEKWLEEKA